MEPNDKKIPIYVFEDLLFRRRLQRNLNVELERLNNLLAEQNRLLLERKELMDEVHESVQRQWSVGENSESGSQSATEAEEDRNAE